MANVEHVKLADYMERAEGLMVNLMTAKPSFSPIDINIEFLVRDGWSASCDRVRFHFAREIEPLADHPLAAALKTARPHILVRRYDREEDCLAAVSIFVDGDIHILSNDAVFARRYLQGLFLEMPPSFRSADSLAIEENWVADGSIVATFAGMVAGALGWDSTHNIPHALEVSMEEARKALEIANYRSCVVMCRRSLEALLKFAFKRLLGRDPIDNRGRDMMLNSLIQEFRTANPARIPVHLIHIADALRVLGNVPGAHAVEIENYRFSRFDAEFAIGAIGYFVDQYFSKIDTEVGRYYTLTIDLSGNDTPPVGG